uniref:Uncharacterized protein n=1 Tax=Micrurus lemniscatus lemniscatus TaxID=129467 RepID=A0A2D4II83_MICLE
MEEISTDRTPQQIDKSLLGSEEKFITKLYNYLLKFDREEETVKGTMIAWAKNFGYNIQLEDWGKLWTKNYKLTMAAAYKENLYKENVAEAKDEDLGVIMSELIAEALQRDWQEIVNELDEVYRIHTNYARRHKLPREVHIRFARKKVRDIIYKIIKKESMLYKDKEIVTLKQIPR